MTRRLPQLALRLDAAAPDDAARWQVGGEVAYLGGCLRLVLDTDCRTPERRGEELHLPLPPAATPRQIRDAAESWLRDEAMRIFTEQSALAGRRITVVLGFGQCGDWATLEGGRLRCHWRLIEQPAAIINQVLLRAIALGMPQVSGAKAHDDLFLSAR